MDVHLQSGRVLLSPPALVVYTRNSAKLCIESLQTNHLVGMWPRPSQNIVYCGVVKVLQTAPIAISLGYLNYEKALDFRLHILDPPVHYIGEPVYVLSQSFQGSCSFRQNASSVRSDIFMRHLHRHLCTEGMGSVSLSKTARFSEKASARTSAPCLFINMSVR